MTITEVLEKFNGTNCLLCSALQSLFEFPLSFNYSETKDNTILTSICVTKYFVLSIDTTDKK